MSAKGSTVLIVDDEADLLRLIAEEMQLHGYRVLCAENVASALDFLKKETVDVILSDIRMPGLSGIDLFEKVSEKYGTKIPFLFMTGYPDLSVSEALKKGARALIIKPFHMVEVVSAVKKALQE